jgi:virginiamycin A acetyltransferase
MIGVVVFIKRKFDQVILDYKFSRMAYKWRKKNRHNRTFAAKLFPIDRVFIGKHTYGMLDVRSFCDDTFEKLQIGNYVSIANDVVFVLGGQHQTKTLTTFPLKAYFTRVNNNMDSFSKGPIIVEDEVWIGVGALILSGVKIGKGAIVAARSVVTTDIPAYAVVAGNPAKIIKYRFSEDIIAKIFDIKLTDISELSIQANYDLFYKEISNDNNVIEMIKMINSYFL